MAEVEEVDPSVLIGKLLDGTPGDEFEVRHWTPEGKEVKSRVRLHTLRAEENIQAIKAAQDDAKERGELHGYGDIYKEAQAHQILQRALRRPEKHTRPDGTTFYPHLFTDTRQLLSSLTEPTMGVLLNCFEIVKAKYGAIESLEERDAETWIARMSDPLRGPFYLSQLDSRHWPALIWLLAGTARDLCQRHGHPLPNSDGIWESDPSSSAEDIGSSGELPSASSIPDPELEIPNDHIVTRDEARQIAHGYEPDPGSDDEE